MTATDTAPTTDANDLDAFRERCRAFLKEHATGDIPARGTIPGARSPWPWPSGSRRSWPRPAWPG